MGRPIVILPTQHPRSGQLAVAGQRQRPRIARARGRDQALPETPTFDDVPADHPVHQEIEALVAHRMTDGCGAGSFCPTRAAERDEGALLAVRGIDLDGSDPGADPEENAGDSLAGGGQAGGAAHPAILLLFLLWWGRMAGRRTGVDRPEPTAAILAAPGDWRGAWGRRTAGCAW